MHSHRLSRQESREQTRRRLLDAGASVIASRGLAPTTVEDIVEHAGYTRGAFYSNFVSKLDLFSELLKADRTRIKDGLRRLLATSLHNEDPEHDPTSSHGECHEWHKNSMLWVEARHHAMRDTAFRRELNALVLELHEVAVVAIDKYCKRMDIEPSRPISTLALATLALIDGSLYFDIDKPREKPGGALRANLNMLLIAAFSGKRA